MHHGGFGGSMLEEDALGKAYDARLMRRLLKYLKPYKGYAIVGLILTIMMAALAIAPSLLVREAIDGPILQGSKIAMHQKTAGLSVAARVASTMPVGGVPGAFAPAAYAGAAQHAATAPDPEGQQSALMWICLAFLGVLLLSFVVMYAQAVILNHMGQRTMLDLRTQLFNHIQEMSVSYHSKNPVGRLVTRVTNDIEALNELFTSGIVTVFGDVLIITGIIAVMFSVSWKLTFVALSAGPFLAIITLLFRRKARKLYRETRVRLARINAYLAENIGGMKVIQIFLREKTNFRRFKDINRDYRTVSIQTVFYYALFFPGVELINSLSKAAIVYFGGVLIIGSDGAFTFGSFYLFWSLLERFFEPIRDLTEKYNVLQAAMAASERIFRILDTEPDIGSPRKPVPITDMKGEIAFRDVSFAYVPGEDILKKVSFTIRPGEKVALVGSTGAGKSTIANLVLRFYDVTEGKILIDGVDVRDFDHHELRKHTGLVLQDVFLFTGTVMQNIRLGSELITEEEAMEAARHVNAEAFISELDGGYQSKVMERGSTYSTGQRQLVSFARALAFDPKILILDEATSSVDPQTERLIQTALETLMENRTSIIIAHRLSTIKKVDRILVVHKGKICEEGTHAELLDKKGTYWKLYQLQYEGQESEVATELKS